MQLKIYPTRCVKAYFVFVTQEKCIENSYQLKGFCQPCPDGTYQDRPGQTECWPCSKRPNDPSFHYSSRCQKRRKELAGHHHPAIAVLLANKHLIRNKSNANFSSVRNSKLGQIAAAATPPPNYNSINYRPSKYSKKSLKKSRLPSSKTRRNLVQYYPATGGETERLKKKKANETVESPEDDPCWPSPCLEGGTCLRTKRFDDDNNLVPHFKCSCRPGATGEQFTFHLLNRWIHWTVCDSTNLFCLL